MQSGEMWGGGAGKELRLAVVSLAGINRTKRKNEAQNKHVEYPQKHEHAATSAFI
jgi:hypothetical protein